MPKLKRKHHESAAQVLGERDVRKLQKLMHTADEEEESGKRDTRLSKRSLSLPDDLDEQITDINFPAICLTDDTGEEYSEEWGKFFAHTDPEITAKGEDIKSQLIKHIEVSKVELAEEMSEGVGSVLGDVEDFKGVDDVAELPEALRDHIYLLIDVLKHYRSGPLPKTIKMLPHLPSWEALIEILKPLEWTPHAYARVVKVFASKGNEPAQYFYEQCLLPKIQQNISENRRLSVQLFEALMSSMFRPQEFVSGLFLPWIQSDMNKTEGVILAHLLKKATLKARFTAVALALVLEEEFTIPRSLIIESLLSKRCHLPETAIARVVDYFLSFDKNCTAYYTIEQRMPVTWFKSLLIFLDLYREALSSEAREKLLKLCRRHVHPQITADIRSCLTSHDSEEIKV